MLERIRSLGFKRFIPEQSNKTYFISVQTLTPVLEHLYQGHRARHEHLLLLQGFILLSQRIRSSSNQLAAISRTRMPYECAAEEIRI